MVLSRFCFLLTVISLGIIQPTLAQEKSMVGGAVADTANTPMTGATVVLMQASDSVLVEYALVDQHGRFLMKNVDAGDYLLKIAFMGYRSHYQPITADGKAVNLGTIVIEEDTKMLGAFTAVDEHVPILIKGDTIEYNADAFKTQPNAAVEDMLKQLPGVEVDENGNIKAQGEDVKKVLVEGKEFFGDDPTIATKNLPADALSRVQVFDKQSEMAEFTGVDDGQREKTINLILKEGKKSGYFGNAELGYGNDDRFQGKANINRFSKKMQLSFLGRANNVNQVGFSFDEYINMMGGIQSLINGSSSGNLMLNSDDMGGFIGGGPGNGYITSGMGGMNFNYDFSKKTDLQSSYFYSGIKNDISQFTDRQNFLNGDDYFSSEIENQTNSNGNHRLNAYLRHKFDTIQNLSFRVNAGYGSGKSNLESTSKTYDFNDLLENESVRDNSSVGSKLNLKSTLTYRRKFKKKGRFFATTLTFGLNDTKNDADLYATNSFYDDLLQPTTNIVDQRHDRDNSDISYQARFSYTEPLGKGHYLELNYANYNIAEALRYNVYNVLSYDPIIEEVNDALSNNYDRGYIYNKGGMNIRRVRKKSNLLLGAGVQQSVLNGEVLGNEVTINQSFVNVLPNLSWNYDISTGKRVSFDYYTNVREPSLQQLQPIVDNSNPLSLYVGNPDLQPEYNHEFYARFSSFTQFTFTSIFATFRGIYTTNKIINATSMDTMFVQTLQPVNVDNDVYLDGYFEFGRPMNFIKTRFTSRLNSTYSRGIFSTNGILDYANRYSNSLGLRFENKKKTIVDVGLGGKVTHNITKYDSGDFDDITYINQVYYLDFAVTIKKNWYFKTSYDYNIYGGSAGQSDQVVPIWKAALSRYFTATKRLEAKASVVDILNQNTGIDQRTELNYIQYSKTQTLGRYFMFSLTYALSKVGKKDKGNMIHISSGGDGR
jgi:hypothetical protein